MKTAVNATRLGIAAYIVPYIFAFFPALIMQVPVEAPFVVINVVFALCGLFAIAAGIQGYLFGKINPILRIVAVGAGLCIMIPMAGMHELGTIWINLIGFAVVAGFFIFQKLLHRNSGDKDNTPRPQAA